MTFATSLLSWRYDVDLSSSVFSLFSVLLCPLSPIFDLDLRYSHLDLRYSQVWEGDRVHTNTRDSLSPVTNLKHTLSFNLLISRPQPWHPSRSRDLRREGRRGKCAARHTIPQSFAVGRNSELRVYMAFF